METFRKIDENTLGITPEVKEVVEVGLTPEENEANLKQAQDSRVYAYEQHIKPIDDTIIIMQKRVDEQNRLNIVTKEVEVVKEVLPVDILETLQK